MVMENPSPPCVGREFVKQYYTMLNQAPEFLYRFYSHDSSFLHSRGFGNDADDEPQVVIGQAEINKVISTLGFRDCHAKIHQVDSQATVGDGVVVQVVGELSNDSGPLRRFVQTFVLASQSAKKYYVHNDIFRYQDDIFQREMTAQLMNAECYSEQHQPLQQQDNHHDAPDTGVVGCNGGSVDDAGQELSHLHLHHYQLQQQQQQPEVMLPPPVSHYDPIVIEPSSLSNGIDHNTDHGYYEQQPTNVITDEQSQPPSSLDEVSHVVAAAEPITEEPAGAETSEPVALLTEQCIEAPSSESQEPLVVTSEPQSTDVKQEAESIETAKVESRPMTWAALAGKTPPAAPAHSTTAAPHGTTRSAARPHTNTASSRPPHDHRSTESSHPSGGSGASSGGAASGAGTPASHPTPKNAFNHQRNSRYSLGATTGSQEPAEHSESSRASLDGEDAHRPFIPPQTYPDSQQVFVGNLPQYLSDKELREFFEQFGPIVEMKINRKSINVNNLPNFGFIAFENAEIVQKILASRPLFLTGVNGKHRVNVEEKKSRGELSALRPHSAPRGGMRPPGGYGRGANNYGRGGGPRPGFSHAPVTTTPGIATPDTASSRNSVASTDESTTTTKTQ